LKEKKRIERLIRECSEDRDRVVKHSYEVIQNETVITVEKVLGQWGATGLQVINLKRSPMKMPLIEATGQGGHEQGVVTNKVEEKKVVSEVVPVNSNNVRSKSKEDKKENINKENVLKMDRVKRVPVSVPKKTPIKNRRVSTAQKKTVVRRSIKKTTEVS